MQRRDDPESRLMNMLAGKWISAALSTAAEIGLADALSQGPCDAQTLATRLECQPGPLLRLLRVLSGEGVVEVDAHGVYALTELGEPLRAGQLGELARFIGADFMWRPWSALPEAMTSEVSAFERTQGASLFEYLDQHEDDARLYHVAVDAFTRREARALAEAFDFSGARRVVDVGGGLGTLLLELSARWPNLSCVLYDRPSVIEAARRRLTDQAPQARFELVGGDFFRDDPPEADLFVIKHVLHNWDDERARSLLEKCVARLRPGGQVLIIEGILLPGNLREPTRLMDLEMLVLCGEGRERSKGEFRMLLKSAGLKLLSTHDLAGTTRLIVSEPR